MEDAFRWVHFYEEFAEKLLSLHGKEDITAKVRLALETPMTGPDGEEIPPVASDVTKEKNLDPFTIFSLFNMQASEDYIPEYDIRRATIAKRIKQVFDISADSPESFEGIPITFNVQAYFYKKGDLNKDEKIELLWHLFELVINYSRSQTPEAAADIAACIDKVVHQKTDNHSNVISISKLSKGLFWVAPRQFLSLDWRNKKYVMESPEFPEYFRIYITNDFREGEEYFRILAQLKTLFKNCDPDGLNICKLSINAYNWSNNEKLSYQLDMDGSYWEGIPGTSGTKKPVTKPREITDEEWRFVKQRRGQNEVRAEVLAKRQICEVTGFSLQPALVASHIKPWRDCKKDEKLDPDNILLLSPDLDTLFDKGFISFDDEGQILISEALKGTNLDHIGIDNSLRIERRLSKATKKYLKYHRENLFKKNSDTK
jgi:hypothetical protein